VWTTTDKWGKPDKLEPCNRQLITVLEKQYGANSPQLVSTLTSEAQVLRPLGRPKEAASVEDRLASIRSAIMVRLGGESFISQPFSSAIKPTPATPAILLLVSFPRTEQPRCDSYVNLGAIGPLP
jgi:hypothetical protein